QQRGTAEPHVGQPGFVAEIDLQQHMRAGARGVTGAEPHAGRQRPDLKAHLPQHGAEQRVLLEAIAAAAAGNQLGLQAVEIECDRKPKHHIEVLEGDAHRMREMQRRERFERRRQIAGVSDPREIGIEIEGRGCRVHWNEKNCLVWLMCSTILPWADSRFPEPIASTIARCSSMLACMRPCFWPKIRTTSRKILSHTWSSTRMISQFPCKPQSSMWNSRSNRVASSTWFCA